jgi:glycosyltransferase involved in cell wall biosynthesis
VRVLYFADIRFPLERANGIQTMETCHALARRGHFVSLVVRPDTQSPSRNPFEFYGLPLIARFSIEYAPVSGPPFARRAGYLAFAIGRMLGASRADVVMTRDLGVGSALLRVPRTLRPPVVYESHGYAPDVAVALPEMIATAAAPTANKVRRLERREAHAWRNADGYVTITSGLAEELTTRFGTRTPIAVIPDGARTADRDNGTRITTDQGYGTRITTDQNYGTRIATDQNYGTRIATDQNYGTRIAADQNYGTRIAADQNYGTRIAADQDRGARVPADHGSAEGEGRPVVVYAGHLYAWKGVDVLLDALRELGDVRGLIVGGHEKEPDLARLREQAARLGISDRVTFTGLVAPPDVAGHLRAGSVLVLPNPASAISTRFTSPLKLFEYMAAGRPIVASDLPSIREVLRHEQNALLVEPGDAAALAAGVRRLLDDRPLADRLAQAAVTDVASYSWDRRAERLETLLLQVTHPTR